MKHGIPTFPTEARHQADTRIHHSKQEALDPRAHAFFSVTSNASKFLALFFELSPMSARSRLWWQKKVAEMPAANTPNQGTSVL